MNGSIALLADLLLLEVVEQISRYNTAMDSKSMNRPQRDYMFPLASDCMLGSKGHKLWIMAGLMYPACVVSSAVRLGDKILS